MTIFFQYSQEDADADICHKHHKQCLCKIILTPGKISERENFFSVNSKTFVLLLVELLFKARSIFLIMKRVKS